MSPDPRDQSYRAVIAAAPTTPGILRRDRHHLGCWRPLDRVLSEVAEDPILMERRPRQAIVGGQRIGRAPASADQVTLVGVGAMLPEVVRAAGY